MRVIQLLLPLSLFGCSLTNAEDAPVIENQHFTLALGDEWAELPNDDPEQYNLYDEERDTAITLSSVGMDASPEQLELVANKMIEFRLRGEEDMAREFGLSLTIAEPISVERPWGYAIAYYGSDQNGRQFSYSGMITTTSVINLYISSGKLSEKELQAAMGEVGSKIEFDRTVVN